MGVFDNKEFDNHEHISFCCDEKTGLKAIIAIHSTAFPLKSAGGGCRFYPYPNYKAALTDVLRLSKTTTFKNAIAGIMAGGANSVIIGDPTKDKSEALFEAFGAFVERLNSCYVTTEDVGTTNADMAIIKRQTNWVRISEPGENRASATGEGVYYAIKAAADYVLKRKTGSVAIQGFGRVGRCLADHLIKDGVKIYVADVNDDAVKLAHEQYGAIPVSPNYFYSLDVDVLAPCALGMVLNNNTIPKIKAPIVCGSANNQLVDNRSSTLLRNLGITYIPDYVANAGGAILSAAPYVKKTGEEISQQIARIYDSTLEVLSVADHKGISTEMASTIMAQNIMKKFTR